MRKALACVFLGGAVLAASGCSDDAVEEVDTALDCTEICDHRDDCVTETDETECVDYCRERADDNQLTENAVEACNDCLDDTNCTEALACWSACAAVPTISGD